MKKNIKQEEDQYIVFYSTLEKGKGFWKHINGKKMPVSWEDGGFTPVPKGVLNNKYDTEAWFHGLKYNSKEMRDYLKWLYGKYQEKDILNILQFVKKCYSVIEQRTGHI